MSDWIKTKAGLQMAETIIRYLPRITVCLEELAKDNPTHKYRDDLIKIVEEIDIRKQENINLKHRIKELETKRIAHTPVGEGSKLSYVLTEDIKRIDNEIKKTPEYKIGKSIISSIGYRGEE